MKAKAIVYLPLLLVALLTLVFVACRDQSALDKLGPVNGTMVEGTVTALDGSPLVGVKVKSGQDSTLTDGAGHYRLYNGELQNNRAIVHFSKEGFFKVTNGATRPADAGTTVNAVLLQRVLLGTINNLTGGSVSSADGLTFSFAPNTFNRPDNMPFKGQINIYGALIDAEHPRIGELMPGGDFLARDPNDPTGTGILETFGAFYVDAEGVGEGKSVQDSVRTIVIPNRPFDVCFTTHPSIVAGIIANGNRVTIWRYDYNRCLWVQEQYPVRVNGNEVCAQLMFVGACNVDQFFNMGFIRGRICRPDGSPSRNTVIRFRTYVAYTDSRGNFVIPVFANAGVIRLQSPYGSVEIPNVQQGQTIDLGSLFCDMNASMSGKIYFSTEYDNVVCADSNTYPASQSRWQPTIQGWGSNSFVLSSISRNCQNHQTRIVSNMTLDTPGTYRIPANSNANFMEFRINGKIYSTKQQSAQGVGTLGGTITMASVSMRGGMPAVGIGSYNVRAAYFDNQINRWDVKTFSGNFRLQVQ